MDRSEEGIDFLLVKFPAKAFAEKMLLPAWVTPAKDFSGNLKNGKAKS
jgi:hypothetical protein